MVVVEIVAARGGIRYRWRHGCKSVNDDGSVLVLWGGWEGEALETREIARV